MPQSRPELAEKFMTENSDGIAEAEAIVRKYDGLIEGNGVIKLPVLDKTKHTPEQWVEVWDAVEYLIQEWDYALIEEAKVVKLHYDWAKVLVVTPDGSEESYQVLASRENDEDTGKPCVIMHTRYSNVMPRMNLGFNTDEERDKLYFGAMLEKLAENFVVDTLPWNDKAAPDAGDYTD